MGVGVGAGRGFIGSVYVVDGTSMTPTYAVGTHLYGAPISTRLERGDVVILDDGQADYAVKRIVGLPGETVQLWRGQVFINREMLVETYLPKHVYTYPAEPLRRGATFVLGEDQYIVLGDNRPSSADSRTYGPVSRKQIKRRVPQSEDFVGAYFAPYTLPDYGNSMIRPLSASVRRRPESSVSEKRSEPGVSRGAPSAALKSEGRNPKAEARTALGLGFRPSDFNSAFDLRASDLTRDYASGSLTAPRSFTGLKLSPAEH